MSECNNRFTNTVHRQRNFVDRYDYFTSLSEAYNVPVMKIILQAEQLGIEQDFTGLVEWVSQEALDVIRQENNKYK